MKFHPAILFVPWLLVHGLHAATVSVTPGQFTTFALDVDGDGVAELGDLQGQSGGISYGVQVDGTAAGSHVIFPDATFAGFESRNFAGLSALSLDSIFNGTFTAPAVINRAFDNFGGVGFADISAPVHAWWAYGTAGSGSAPLSLIGIVVDFSAYLSSGGTAAVDIHYHHYGTFSSGQSTGPISLAATGVPEPGPTTLLMAAVAAGLLRRRR